MSLQTSFELPLDVLRARRNEKWNRYAPDVLPAFVAEMDFSVSHAIQRAMERMVRDQDYGYPHREGGKAGSALAEAFAARMQSRFGWSLDASLVDPLGDLVQGTFAAITAFSDPGDGVVLHLPAYPPFHAAIHQTGRRLIASHLRSNGSRYELDLDAMRASVDPTTRIILLCSPQNPTGRVFSRDELTAIGAMAIEHNLVIVADEIHADLIHPGNVHIPIASISPEIAARTVTITSATKGFNIPGLRCGVMHFGAAPLRERLRARIPERIMGQPGIAGIDATIAAWRHGQAWLDDVLAHLGRMRDKVAGFVAAELPELRMHAPEATYLAWLDCSRLGLNGTAFDFFHDRAKVAFSPGEAFDPERGDFARLNFATSGAILDQILGRMKEAVKRR